MVTSQRTDQVVDDILDAAGWDADDRDLDTGKTTITRYWKSATYTVPALQEVESTEGGFIREGKDGKIVFDNRHHRLAGASSGAGSCQKARPVAEAFGEKGDYLYVGIAHHVVHDIGHGQVRFVAGRAPQANADTPFACLDEGAAKSAALGDKPKAMKTAMSNMFDSDGDGVLEDKDRCPGTPTGVPVDATGCPDSDGDGVGDAYDECPGTPKGVRVDSRGCSLDSDGDGVFDYADKCPNTPAGVAVDADGCPATGDLLRKFEDVNFAFDRSDLTDYAKITLDNTAKVIKELQKQYPDLRVEISGHADWVGSEAYNLNLGLRRAAKVRDYLVSKGVSRGLISTTSLGESQPIASNKTDKGRLLNRRAEIRAKGNSK